MELLKTFFSKKAKFSSLGAIPDHTEVKDYLGMSEKEIREIYPNVVVSKGSKCTYLEIRLQDATLTCVLDNLTDICIQCVRFDDKDEEGKTLDFNIAN